jgi:hypothetical protein
MCCRLTHGSEDPEFKYLAQKCFVSYFKSVWLQVVLNESVMEAGGRVGGGGG